MAWGTRGRKPDRDYSVSAVCHAMLSALRGSGLAHGARVRLPLLAHARRTTASAGGYDNGRLNLPFVGHATFNKAAPVDPSIWEEQLSKQRPDVAVLGVPFVSCQDANSRWRIPRPAALTQSTPATGLRHAVPSGCTIRATRDPRCLHALRIRSRRSL